MSITQNRLKEKEMKFHQEVKEFYYKNIFRKIYTVAIIGLVVANVISILKYSSFAHEWEWNTAALTTNITEEKQGCSVVISYGDGETPDELIELNHGESTDVYPYSYTFGSVNTCAKETWTCNDGVIEGNSKGPGDGYFSYGYGNCYYNPNDACGYSDEPSQLRISQGCSFSNGESYCHWVLGTDVGEVVDGYPKSDATCESKQYICGEGGHWYNYSNGTMGGMVGDLYYHGENCEVQEQQVCTYKGVNINKGDHITVYKKDTMPYGTENGCDGIIDGDSDNVNSATLYCDDERRFYLVDHHCSDLYETEADIEAHGYGFTSCTVEEQGEGHGVAESQNCTTSDGHVVVNGETIEGYLDNFELSYDCDAAWYSSFSFFHNSNYSRIKTLKNSYNRDIHWVGNKQRFTCVNGDFYLENGVVDGGGYDDSHYDGIVTEVYTSCYKSCNAHGVEFDEAKLNDGDYRSQFTTTYIRNGVDIINYPYGTIFGSDSCSKQTLTCNNGTWEGSERSDGEAWGYGSCGRGCTYADDEERYQDNKSVANYAYSVGEVYGEYCPESKSYYCEEGNWYEYNNGKGDPVDSVYYSCSNGCLLNDGTTFNQYQYITAFKNRIAPVGQACEPTSLYCSSPKTINIDGNGLKVTDGNWYGQCEAQQLKKDCPLLDGTILEDGQIISAYKKQTAPYGDNNNTCSAETIKCENGELKDINGEDVNGYGFPGCTYVSPQSCTFKGVNIIGDNNSNITVYKSATGIGSCNFGINDGNNEGYLFCDNGKFKFHDGDGHTFDTESEVEEYGYGFTSCTIVEPQACTLLDGSTLEDGESIPAYKKATAPYGDSNNTCSAETIKCENGELKDENGEDANGYGFPSCTVVEPQACTLLDGSTLEDGESIPAYKKATAPYGDSNNTCSAETIKCEDGELKDENGEDANGYGFPSCTYALPQSCTFKGVKITGDNSNYITVYKKLTVPYGTENGCNGYTDGSRNSGPLYCNNGKFRMEDDHLFDTESDVESYGYGFTSCTVAGNTTPTQPSGGGGGGGGGGGSSKNTHNAADDKTNVEEEKTNQELEKEKINQEVKEVNEEVDEGVDEGDKKEETVDEIELQKGKRFQSIEITTDMEQYNPTYSLEENTAYQFAKANGITSKSTIQEANMNKPLTRIQMAKMLSYYAMNVLGQTPKEGTGVVSFSDVPKKLDEQYDNGVTLSYQLGIMGQNMQNNKFRPYEEVTRAQFTAALSRMLYEVVDGTGKTEYYEPHMAKLYNEGIITKKDPNKKEKRGYVMLMLMRSAK